MNKYHLCRKNTDTELVSRYCQTDNLDSAMNVIMGDLFGTCGNGDGENGGAGSLWRCAREIYDCIRSGGHYFYDDFEWWIEGINEPEKKNKKYLFRFSTILDGSVEIEGETYEEAKKKSKEWADEQIKRISYIFRDKDNPWKCCGSWNDEGEDEIPIDK